MYDWACRIHIVAQAARAVVEAHPIAKNDILAP
jgi:hypothetical protein